MNFFLKKTKKDHLMSGLSFSCNFNLIFVFLFIKFLSLSRDANSAFRDLSQLRMILQVKTRIF
nr:MAG TPA: hypothetical protein [Caudoviricetes sp.]DAX94516.1 MAG TPA: hypothetical protein [Caudoviricetes sp.]